MTENIEKISKFIPLISILILLSSVIRNYIFYQSFGISINEYINLTEFTLLFINDLSFYILTIPFFFMYLPFIYIRKFVREKYGAEHFNFERTKKLSEFVMLTSIFSSIMIFILDFSLQVQLNLLQTFITIFFSSLLLWFDKDVEFSKKYSLIVASFMLILFPILKAINDVDKIENKNFYNEVSFIYNNKEIHSNKEQIFLGKTNEYLFLYNSKTKYTEVFRNSDINNFKIKKL